VLYLLVYCALGLWLGHWSLRERGHLAVALAVCLNCGSRGWCWLGVLFFHRSFMFHYVDIPATALLLAAFGEPGPAARPRAAP
jgi:hypothetical protein